MDNATYRLGIVIYTPFVTNIRSGSLDQPLALLLLDCHSHSSSGSALHNFSPFWGEALDWANYFNLERHSQGSAIDTKA